MQNATVKLTTDAARRIVPVPACRLPRSVDCDAKLADAVAWVAWADAEAEAIQAEADRECATIKANVARRIAKIRTARVDNAGLQVERYVAKHRRRLLADGKTIRFPGGTVSVRTGNEAVTISGSETEAEVVERISAKFGADRDLSAALEASGAGTFLRYSLALNRERIKRDAAKGLVDSRALAGLRLRIDRPESIRVSRAA